MYLYLFLTYWIFLNYSISNGKELYSISNGKELYSISNYKELYSISDYLSLKWQWAAGYNFVILCPISSFKWF